MTLQLVRISVVRDNVLALDALLDREQCTVAADSDLVAAHAAMTAALDVLGETMDKVSVDSRCELQLFLNAPLLQSVMAALLTTEMVEEGDVLTILVPGADGKYRTVLEFHEADGLLPIAPDRQEVMP